MTSTIDILPVLPTISEIHLIVYEGLHIPEVFAQQFPTKPPTYLLPETLESGEEGLRLLKRIIWTYSRCSDPERDYFQGQSMISIETVTEHYQLLETDIPLHVDHLLRINGLDISDFQEACDASERVVLVQLANKVGDLVPQEIE